MPKLPVPFIKGDTIGDETDYRDALPVNMYAVARPIFGADGYMVQNYGLSLFGNGTGIDRGGFYNDRQKNHFRVSGTDFIEVDENGVANVLGTVTGSDPVTLDYSFNTQAVLANKRFYYYDTTNGFVENTDPNLGDPIDFVWVDGYYFFTDGENLYHTTLADETVIDPLDFGVAQFMPDGSLGVEKTQDDKVIVFGRYSTEFFVNDASAEFAFTRVASRAIKKGIVATHCKAELNGAWYILGGARYENIAVHVLGVGSANKISTREVEKVISQYDEPELVNSVVEAYTIDKTNFIKVHLPNEVLLFNESVAKKLGLEDAWTILKSDVLGDTPDRAIYHVFDARVGEWIVGDKQTSNLGILDRTVATQYDEITEWLLFSPFIYLESNSIDEFEIEIIPGHTMTDDATVFISLTYNGVTYGKEWTEEYGMINDYNKRFIVRRLGYVRDWVGIKLRGATRSRMAFARGFITHG